MFLPEAPRTVATARSGEETYPPQSWDTVRKHGLGQHRPWGGAGGVGKSGSAWLTGSPSATPSPCLQLPSLPRLLTISQTGQEEQEQEEPQKSLQVQWEVSGPQESRQKATSVGSGPPRSTQSLRTFIEF